MNIYVWGTGCKAANLFTEGFDLSQITAFVENRRLSSTFLGKPVLTPEELSVSQVDLLLITSSQTASIEAQCAALGIPSNRLYYMKNAKILMDRNENCLIAKEVLDPALLQKFHSSCQIVTEPRGIQSQLSSQEKEYDYVRSQTLELLCRQLCSVPGALAELGVFQGRFARLMNKLLPDRPLYLFDTFQGFDQEEGLAEQRLDRCDSHFLMAHKNTSAATVLAQMPHPEQVHIRQGLFPQTSEGLEECFALVSLDADFEESTYEGLCYFWPRLSSGGYLLLHDYNAPDLKGVKKAVTRYEEDHNLHLPGVPLCDINGTYVLCKP